MDTETQEKKILELMEMMQKEKYSQKGSKDFLSIVLDIINLRREPNCELTKPTGEH